VRKEDVDEFAARRPFKPFEVRLVDGQRFRFTKVEQFIVGRSIIAALSRDGNVIHISIALISTVRPVGSNGKRQSRRASGGR